MFYHVYHVDEWYPLQITASKRDCTMGSMSMYLFPGSGLIVRRGSEPALINIGTPPPKEHPETPPPSRPNKRWSAIASVDATKVPRVSTNVSVMAVKPNL